MSTKPLKANCLSFTELLAQAVALISPTMTAALIIPVMYSNTGDWSWLSYALGTVMLLFVAYNLNQFAKRSTGAGSMYAYISRGLGLTAGAVGGWSLIWAYLGISMAGVTGFTIFAGKLLAMMGIIASPYLLFAACVGAAWFCAWKNVQLSAIMMLICEGASMALIGVLCFIVLGQHHLAIDTAQFTVSKLPWSSVGLGVVVAIFSLVLVWTASVRHRCARMRSVEDLRQRRPSMEQIIRIGMDTSKHIFQLHGVNSAEAPVLRKKLRRKEMVRFFDGLAPTEVAIEACGSSHYWARLLESLGHRARLIPPQFVKPYVKRNKNDAADAEALCEAMGRPTMRFVPVKTAEKQAALMLVGVRERLVRNRTQLSNSIRGYASEFGLIASKGLCRIEQLLVRAASDETIPTLARELFAIHGKEYGQLQGQLEKIEARLMAWHRADACSQRLAEIPGIGPIGASMLVMKTPAPETFRSSRHFAAWLGLTPKDHSIAGKSKLGGITRAGDEALRSVLVAGSTSVLHRVRQRGTGSPWLIDLLKRKPPKLAAVALANKNARIARKLMVSGERYRTNPTPTDNPNPRFNPPPGALRAQPC